MKKRLAALLLCAALGLAPAEAALAAEPPAAGFYNVGSADGVEVMPLTAEGETAAAVSRDVDGEPGEELFYPGSRTLRVTLPDTVPGKMYFLAVSAGETVYYADQQTGGGTILFLAAFLLPEEPAELLLSVGSDAEGFTRLDVPLFYTACAEAFTPPAPVGPQLPPLNPPEPEAEADTGDCPRDGSCPLAAYADLDPAGWYHDGVHFALENRIMNGVSAGSFAPNDPTSRAMLVTMLWRMEGEPAANGGAGFADVPPDAWYGEAVRWAASEGLVEGYGAERFAPGDPVSREQLATILRRYAAYKEMELPASGKVNLGIYIDAERISPWAETGMQWAVDTGLITGVGGERLSPADDADRAQVATVLMRLARLG